MIQTSWGDMAEDIYNWIKMILSYFNLTLSYFNIKIILSYFNFSYIATTGGRLESLRDCNCRPPSGKVQDDGDYRMKWGWYDSDEFDIWSMA